MVVEAENPYGFICRLSGRILHGPSILQYFETSCLYKVKFWHYAHFSDPISLTHVMSTGLGTSFEHFYRLVPSVICNSHLSYFCMFFFMLTTECSILIAVYC